MEYYYSPLKKNSRKSSAILSIMSKIFVHEIADGIVQLKLQNKSNHERIAILYAVRIGKSLTISNRDKSANNNSSKD